MSWLCRDAELVKADWGLLDFTTSKSEIFTIAKCRTEYGQEVSSASREINPGNAVCRSKKWSLLNDRDWEEWLDNGPLETQGEAASTSRINLVLSGRTAALEKLPFSRHVFSRIKDAWRLHGSIVRAINRNTSCTFSRISFDWERDGLSVPSIVYNCRTAESWDGDMALSVTFFPETLEANAVWYGCNLLRRDNQGYQLTDSDIITGRLSNFDGQTFHPMLLPTIFADFERDRQFGIVGENLSQLVQRVLNLASRGSQPPTGREITMHSPTTDPSTQDAPLVGGTMRDTWRKIQSWWDSTASTPSSNVSYFEEKASPPQSPVYPANEESSVILWIKISDLRNGLENWRNQLLKMIEHVDELDKTDFGMPRNAMTEEWQSKLPNLRETGMRIKERLQDLVSEYDERIRDCTHTMNGMTLATQLELNYIGQNDARTNREISKVNLEVANMARRDGNLMKSIAFLGMIFLPATFVSTFFSMDFFQWTKDDQNTVSPLIWIYVVVAAGLTFFTVAIFVACTRRRHRTDLGANLPA